MYITKIYNIIIYITYYVLKNENIFYVGIKMQNKDAMSISCCPHTGTRSGPLVIIGLRLVLLLVFGLDSCRVKCHAYIYLVNYTNSF